MPTPDPTRRSCARAQNSLLRSKYPSEPVAWIGTLPDGTGATISFAELIGADGPSVTKLAESLGLSPGEGEGRVDTLNKIMVQLGVSCRHFCVACQTFTK